MKNVAIVSFALMLFVTGVANSAITTATYQVSAGPDDGFATAAAVQDITAGYLKIGDERTYNVPYQMSGMRFNNVDIPRSATITSAYLKINSINTDYRGRIYGVIAAEASDNPADFSIVRQLGRRILNTQARIFQMLCRKLSTVPALATAIQWQYITARETYPRRQEASPPTNTTLPQQQYLR
ncbi:MAG: hypothetical protein ACYSYU_08825 [Planctomycetota bacterium]|jgi:hypothetical protein